MAGHYFSYHLWWTVALQFINHFLLFLAFTKFYKSSAMFEVFKFPTKYHQPIIIAMELVKIHIMSTINFVCQHFIHINQCKYVHTFLLFLQATNILLRKIGRHFVLQADNFAVEQGYGEPLLKAVLKTNIASLYIGEYHVIYTWYYLEVPPTSKRLRLIEEKMQKMK
jgi:Zn-dependent protease with chaperone function